MEEDAEIKKGAEAQHSAGRLAEAADSARSAEPAPAKALREFAVWPDMLYCIELSGQTRFEDVSNDLGDPIHVREVIE